MLTKIDKVICIASFRGISRRELYTRLHSAPRDDRQPSFSHLCLLRFKTVKVSTFFIIHILSGFVNNCPLTEFLPIYICTKLQAEFPPVFILQKACKITAKKQQKNISQKGLQFTSKSVRIMMYECIRVGMPLRFLRSSADAYRVRGRSIKFVGGGHLKTFSPTGITSPRNF